MSDVEKQMAKYCYEVCPEQHHLALSVSRSIESFAGANELEDGVSFFHQFPWQRLVDAVASSVFERVVYTEAGGRRLFHHPNNAACSGCWFCNQFYTRQLFEVSERLRVALPLYFSYCPLLLILNLIMSQCMK